ncbi:hypothetical protein EXIGLDRAFT_833529 [Exidia glandulosa HHB12029]|uniref:Mucoidy inhibitor A n=1 Tax=Exidia glandulosa HHB12029 TaxID=1314781 RepID=A0A166AZM7_EXIGL|nr:hypothetical protein EXIGLDRAFT_833529 [Exidia glandulosa HHB12029]
MANKVEYDATAHHVHSVTVFQVDRAEVNRRIQVQLKAGQNDVVVSHLPSYLDEDSIRVDGIGSATVFDVVYSSPPPTVDSAENETLKALEKKRSALEAEKDSLTQQVTVLSDYAKTLNAKDTDASKLMTFLDLFSEKKLKLNEALVAVDDKIAAVEAEIRDEQLSSHEDVESQKRGVKITIVVLSEADGEAELSLTYTVSGASWTPLYDLRASVTDGKEGSHVLLHYRASISQSTGEPWEGVHLTLSTASPQLGSDIPTLSPLTLSEVARYPVGSFARARKSVRSADLAESAPMMALASAPGGGGSPPQMMRMRSAAVTESAVSSTFAIEGLSTIPTDTDDASQTHKVSIAELTFTSVDLEWITVPKEVSSVFLQCKVKNTSEYPLLPGDASVYLGNSFVAKSSIPHVSPHESFSTSLGVDGAVRVTYHPQSKHLKQATGSLFASAKTSTTSFSQRISVKNTRRATVKKLVVRDQVPVSQDGRIKVAVIEPKDIPGSVGASEGVRARWALKNEENPAEGETGDGMLEWVCTVPAGGNVDLNFSWDVTVPVGLQWRSS